ADHGNAEQMFDPGTGKPHTAHTLYDVPLIIVDPVLDSSTKLREGGKLADIFPTALQMMGIPKPDAMTGESLFAL
ncbi:MAG: phosphoglyceromutase, partial [Firmicutes bacterium]|nr:phosphoglyceromutase [Bacillota bacterium]